MSDSTDEDTQRVRVTFKPAAVKPVEATELREVVFTVERDLSDETALFQHARAEAVDQDVIASAYAAREHWEPYKHERI